MVLRASAQTKGENYDLDIVIGHGEGKTGVDQGDLLLAYSDAVIANDDLTLSRIREELVKLLGKDALVDAAGTVASFNAVVRVADATGIPLDEFKKGPALEIMDTLAINESSLRK